jgi:DNA-directed RNA polymerase subunit alpha
MSNAATAVNDRASEEFFTRAKDSEATGNVEKAIEFYERSLAENPDNEGACFRLALLYDRRGEDAKAIELYERICTSEPVHINALMNLAILYEDNNFYDQAKRCLDAVLLTNHNHSRARLYIKDVESARSMYVDDSNHEAERNATLEVPITDFELSVRSRNALKKMNVRTLGDLLRITEADLLANKNFGETSLNEIKSLLAARTMRLGSLAAPTAVAAPRRPVAVNADVPEELLSRSVADVELSVRSRKALQRLNIATVGELASRTEDELLGCKNFGTTSLNELKQILASLGLGFRKLDD